MSKINNLVNQRFQLAFSEVEQEAEQDNIVITTKTKEYAQKFFTALSSTSQSSVDIQVDSDGDIIFEWAENSSWILTLAINKRAQISYSGIFGLNRVRGLEHFDTAIPSFISLALIRFNR